MNKTIKMVVTDMDGTLLNSNREMHPETMSIIDKLIDKGVLFVVASARQYFNLHNRFKNRDDIIYIAENGSYINKDGNLFRFRGMDFQMVDRLTEIVDGIDGAYLVLCGKESAYIKDMNEVSSPYFNEYYDKIEIVDNFQDVTDEICKISILDLNGTEKYVYPLLNEFYEDYKVLVSTHEWLDIFSWKTNKGAALEILQQRLDIKKEETMVFGDNLNDLEMYRCAVESYAMENSHEEIKKVAKHIIGSNDEFSVITELKKVFDL
ncbi:MAG: HAD family phosphatase [Erysipelotrichaceae bacterium]|nr:HAD family phosphatase [Erysipelotrichaceae bacterium]